MVIESTNVTTTTMSDHDTKLWHMRLGHISEHGMNAFNKQGLLSVKRLCTFSFCEICVYAKQKKVSFKPDVHNTKGILDYIHSDLQSLSRKNSLGGCNYQLTFIDDFSRRFGVTLLRLRIK